MGDLLHSDLPGGLAFCLLQASILPAAAGRGLARVILAYWLLLPAALILGPRAVECLVFLSVGHLIGFALGFYRRRLILKGGR